MQGYQKQRAQAMMKPMSDPMRKPLPMFAIMLGSDRTQASRRGVDLWEGSTERGATWDVGRGMGAIVAVGQVGR